MLSTPFEKFSWKAQKGLLFGGKYGIIISAVTACADVAQLVERVLGKDEVTGSIPVISSKNSYK